MDVFHSGSVTQTSPETAAHLAELEEASHPKRSRVVEREVQLEAADGYLIGATSFEPLGDVRATILIHGATAVPQTYYGRFARFAAPSACARGRVEGAVSASAAISVLERLTAAFATSGVTPSRPLSSR